jgi:autotransporter adhesin
MAMGTNANASGDGSANIAIGQNALAVGDGTTNMALGYNAQASGDDSIAIGSGAIATGSIAAGTQAFASNGGAAFGDFASASGANSTAIGPHSSAAYANSAAFGNGAEATRENQQVFGTVSNTYTMAGLTTKASRHAQGTPAYIVTSNAGGDLAAYTPHQLELASTSDIDSLRGGINSLQGDINRLGNRDLELTEGIATAAALAQPVLRSGQHFGVTAGWGGFDNANAVAFSAAGILTDNMFRPGIGTLALYGGVGVGTDEGVVTSRAGVSFGW